MLFTIVLFALAATGPVFSAPVPSTELTLRQESADVAVKRGDDTLSTGALHHRSEELVPRFKTPEKAKRREQRGGGGFNDPSEPPTRGDRGGGGLINPLAPPVPAGPETNGATGGDQPGAIIPRDAEPPAEDDDDEGMSTISDMLLRLY